MIKVADTGPPISQPRLLAIVTALIILALLFSSYIQGRQIDKQREFCASYGAVYDGSGCVKDIVDF